MPDKAPLPLVIIGAGLAGWTTAREFRKLDSSTPVLLITADSGDFYAKPSLSNAFAQKRAPAALVSTPAAKMAASLNLTLLANTAVQGIDTAPRLVRAGAQTLAYRDLVLATGAQAMRLPLEGTAANTVLSVNSLDDFALLHARLAANSTAPAKRVVIMGAGLIGCEFANDLAQAGHGVTVVDPSPRPLAALLPAAASEQLRQALARLGVSWRLGTTVQAVNHALEPGPTALALRLADGQTLHADVVLSAIGLRAQTALAQAAGLACERAIVVDEQLRTSAAHVYALGDSAQYAQGQWAQGAVSGGRPLPFVMPIMNAARALAATLAGTPTALAFPLMPVAVKTPALPLVVAAPAPGSTGDWHAAEPGLWQFRNAQRQQLGFVLAGAQTAQRMAQARLTIL